MYIGKTPTVGNFQVCDAISVVNGQAAYTLQVGGVNVAPESANHMLVSLNGILQKPGSSFTISGSTMTFASNLATGDVIDFVQILGNVLDIGQPSDDTVTAAKINDNVISGQTALAATPADTDELLISDAGTIKRIDFSYLKTGITNAQTWRITSSFTSGTSETDISSNWEESDSTGYARIGDIVTQSSGIFTFAATGIYLLLAQAAFRNNAGTRSTSFNVKATTNNSTYTHVISGEQNNSDVGGSDNTSYHTGALPALFDVTDTTQVKFRFTVQSTANTQTCDGDTDRSYTGFTIVRLGDT
jgi:hypothetical protein